MKLPPLFSIGVLVAMAALSGVVLGSGGGASDVKGCGEVLTGSHGVITTPNFPGPPPMPLLCRWVINASWVEERNVTVYLTQQYVMEGLSIYDFYQYGDKVEGKKIYGGSDDNPIATEYVRSNQPYVAVQLNISRLFNNHLRVLQDLQEVYGFNITYEVTYNGEVARGSCSPIICGFVGQCRASYDFRNYSCRDCPKGYSGPNCTLGPMCSANPCQNGGKCRSTGTESIVCKCEGNFTGVFCQYPPIEDEVRECEAEGDKLCRPNNSSGVVVQPGRMLYTVNVSLSSNNKSTLLWTNHCDITNFETLLLLVTKESIRDLKNNVKTALNLTINNLMQQYTLSSVYDLEVVDIKSDGRMTFQFKTYEDNSAKVSEVLNSLLEESSRQPLCKWSSNFMENGRIKKCTDRDIYLSLSVMSIKFRPVLYLQKLAANNFEPLLPGKQVVFSCVVTGPPNVSFSWYKENRLVIPGLSNRIWTQTSPNLNGTITSLLGVDNLTPLDDGRWTCRVRDGGLHQSRSVDLYVLQSPSVRMFPPTKTTHQGEKVFLSCILSNYDHDRKKRYEYRWIRNEVPLTSGGDHVIELLDYPNGCLLRIQNINESATYTCHVESDVGKTSASARVEVILENTTVCDPDEEWPASPVGTLAMIECPEGREGSLATRQCSVAYNLSSSQICGQWNEPNFSACLLNDAIPLQNDLREIAQGYAPSTPPEVLRRLLSLIGARKTFEPHQGEAVLAVAIDAWRMSGDRPEIHIQMLHLIDLLLSFPRALASPKDITDIAEVSEKTAVAQMKSPQNISPSLRQLSVSFSHPNRADSILRLEKVRPSWCATFHFPEVENLRIPLVVVEFESLRDIIPYNSRLNSSNILYQILSTVTVSTLPKAADLSAARKNVTNPSWVPKVEATFDDLPFNLSNFLAENKSDTPYWNITCAYAHSLKYSPVQWNLGSCTTMISRLDEDDLSNLWLPWHRANAFVFLQAKVSVRCLCPAPGAYAVVLAGFAQKPESGVASVAVILGLWCCAVEASAALLLPFVMSWKEHLAKSRQTHNAAPTTQTQVQSGNSSNSGSSLARSSVSESNIFVAFRVTSCTNTVVVAIVMAVTMCKWDTCFPAVVLQCLLILGISLPTGYLYLFAVELGGFPLLPAANLWSRQYSRSHAVAVVLSIGPVVVFLALWLSIRDLRSTLSQCWTSWLEWGEPVCWAVAIPSSVVAAAGVIIAGVARKLSTITTYSQRVQNDARCGLIIRLCAILVCQLVFLLSTILYTSAPGLASHVALVFASFLLGYSLLICYVLRVEKQWRLLSVAWCHGEPPIDSPQTPRTSTSTSDTPLPRNCGTKWRRLCGFFDSRKTLRSLPNQSCASAPSAQTTPALESPDSLRPLIGTASSKKPRSPTKPQSNGVPNKSTSSYTASGRKSRQPLLPSPHPLQTPLKPEYIYCTTPQSKDHAEGSLLPLREFETPAVKKNRGYLYMRGRGSEVTCTAEVHGGFLGARRPKRTAVESLGENSITNTVPQPQPSTHKAQPQYQFRRRFLRLDDIEESNSAS